MIAASEQAGIARAADVNHSGAAGVGLVPRTIWRGRRQSAAKAFLDPARGRPNLTIVTGTDVVKVVIERGRAVGVQLVGRPGAETALLTAAARLERRVVPMAGAAAPRIYA